MDNIIPSTSTKKANIKDTLKTLQKNQNEILSTIQVTHIKTEKKTHRKGKWKK